MPLIKYQCQNIECAKNFPVLTKAGNPIPSYMACRDCGSKSKRILSAPTSSSKISIDTGQARAVEVDPNIMEQREEWSHKAKIRGE